MAETQQIYWDVLEAVKQYYGSGSDQWAEFAKYGLKADNVEAILKQVPGVEIIKNADGSIRSYNYKAIESVSSSASTLNSNAISTQVKTKIPADMGVDSATGNLTLKSGVKTASGAVAVGNFVSGSVAPAIGAACLGITLGKTIDRVLYNSMPQVWESVNMGSLNPDTWASITTDDTLGGYLFNTLLQLDPDTKSTQMYLDENVIAYTAMYMQGLKMFDSELNVDYENVKSELRYKYDYEIHPYKEINRTVNGYKYEFKDADYYFIGRNSLSSDGSLYGCKKNSYNMIEIITDLSTGVTYSQERGSSYPRGYTYPNSVFVASGDRSIDDSWNVKFSHTKDYANPAYQFDIAYAILYGTITESGAVEGIGTQSGATTPDLSLARSIDEVLTLLKEQYPELWEKAVTQDVIQYDGSVKTYVYIPVATPDAKSATDTQPTSGTSTQADPVVNPETSPEILLDLIASIAGSTPTPTDTNTESETGKGSTPSLIVPVGSASALYKIYNPTQEQLNSFGAWLWSSNFVDQLLKMFNDPMQAIIGLHKVYSPVSVGGSTDIKVGYLSSGVTSNYISEQYVTVDCGSIYISEFFNNVFDYDPFTKVYIYLPFIGIQQLHVGDVMRSSINVKYHVDVLTGTCLAEIYITRDGGGGILYTYSGNCAVQYPLSSGNYMGLVGSLASVAGTAAGTIMSGGAMLPMALHAVGGLSHAHTNVSHSGNFSGNAGAMGVKIPYLIITRPQTELANTFPHNDGYPVNYSTTVGQCSGYIEVESVHVENIPATENELVEIENLLKSGVLV